MGSEMCIRDSHRANSCPCVAFSKLVSGPHLSNSVISASQNGDNRGPCADRLRNDGSAYIMAEISRPRRGAWSTHGCGDPRDDASRPLTLADVVKQGRGHEFRVLWWHHVRDTDGMTLIGIAESTEELLLGSREVTVSPRDIVAVGRRVPPLFTGAANEVPEALATSSDHERRARGCVVAYTSKRCSWLTFV